jgi:excisionase family DNA binding protein
MSDELLRVSEAARQLGILTKDLLRLVHDHEIRYVMFDGHRPHPRWGVGRRPDQGVPN